MEIKIKKWGRFQTQIFSSSIQNRSLQLLLRKTDMIRPTNRAGEGEGGEHQPPPYPRGGGGGVVFGSEGRFTCGS